MNLNSKNKFFEVVRCLTRGDLHSLKFVNSNEFLKYFLPKEENNYKLIRDLLRGTIYLISNPNTSQKKVKWQ